MLLSPGQNRERVYIVGIARRHMSTKTKFQWPSRGKKTALKKILDLHDRNHVPVKFDGITAQHNLATAIKKWSRRGESNDG